MRFDLSWPTWFNGPRRVAALLFLVLMATSTRYGWFRDELYFRALGQRLGVAFVDVPIWTPLVSRATAALFGNSLVALRVWPALCMVGVVLLGTSLSRMLGASERAQTLAAVAIATSPIALIFGHVFHYAAFDLLAWSAIVWCVVAIATGGSPRWWLAVGLISGIGYENKNLIALLMIGLLFGLAATRQLRLLRSRWAMVGATVGIALALPNLVWQFRNDMPEADLARHIRSQASLSDRPLVVVFQAAFVGAFFLGLALRGGRSSWKRSELRFLPVAYLCVLALVIVSGGKHYYAAGLLPPLLAAGAANTPQTDLRTRRGLILGNVAVSALIGLPLLTAVLGSSHSAPIGVPGHR